MTRPFGIALINISLSPGVVASHQRPHMAALYRYGVICSNACHNYWCTIIKDWEFWRVENSKDYSTDGRLRSCSAICFDLRRLSVAVLNEIVRFQRMPEDRPTARSTDGMPSDADTTAYAKFRALARKLFAVPKSDIPPRPKRVPKDLKPKPGGSQ